MKISFVTSNLAPFRIDWLDELAKTQDVTIYYNDDYVKNVNPIYIKRQPKRAKYINISKYIFNNIRIFNFMKIIKNKTDLLILDGYGFFSQVLLIFILKILLRPFVLSVDGGLIDLNEKKFKYEFKKKIISSATYYLSTSNATDDFLMRYGAKKERIFRHKFTSLHITDLNTSIISNDEKKLIRDNLDIVDKFTIIGVGKFIHSKGFDILIDSLKFVKEDVNVVVVGGEITKEYSTLINRNAISNVTFIDFCDKNKLNDYYNAANLFVLPTRSDVWGLVINEAMAKGLPVITTEKCIAGITLIKNGENGFIVPIEDVQALAKYIEILINDDKLCDIMGKNNLAKISEYTFEKIVECDIATFNHILMHRGEKNGK